jgi:hypothetical protein
MRISALYRALGAPQRNIRWSWGATNPVTKTVFLSVWEDQVLPFEGRNLVLMTAPLDPFKDYGYRERLMHVDAIRNGSKAFLIFCKPKSVTERRRSLSTINTEQLFPVLSVETLDGLCYLTFGLPVRRSQIEVQGC